MELSAWIRLWFTYKLPHTERNSSSHPSHIDKATQKPHLDLLTSSHNLDMKGASQKRRSPYVPYTFKFPPELERLIFEFSANSSSRTAIALLQVSREVYSWIMPVLCKVVAHINTSVSNRKYMNQAWYTGHGGHVRHLLLDLSGTDISPFLSLCPNVQNLAIWGFPKDTNQILSTLKQLKSHSDLPLTHLSVNLKRLFQDLYTTTVAPKVPVPHRYGRSAQDTQGFEFVPKLGRHIILQNITHLELINPSGDWAAHSGLPYLPRLSHIALPSMVNSSFVVDVLKHCQEIRAVVLVGPFMVEDEDGEEVTCKFSEMRGIEVDMEYTAFDSGSLGVERIVPVQVAHTEDWIRGARGMQSMWSIADEVIERRRRKWKKV